MLLRLLQTGLRRLPLSANRYVGFDVHFSNLHRSPVSEPLRIYSRLRDVFRQQPLRYSFRSLNKGRALALLLGPTVLCVGGRVAQCHVDLNRHPDESDRISKEAEFDWGEFWNHLRPQMIALITAVLLAFGAALLNIQIPLILGELVNVVSRFAREHADNYLQEIRGPAGKLLYLYGAQGLLTCGYIVLLSRVGERVAGSMRKALFFSLLRQDVAFFDDQKTGLLVNRLTSDVQEFKSSFKQVISQGLRNCTQTVGCFVSLYYISPKLTGMLIVVMPILVGVGAIIGSFLRRLSSRAQEQVAKATGMADEALGNVRTVKAFSMEKREVELYSAEVDRSCQCNEALGVGIAVFQGLSNVALNCIVLGTIFVGGSLMAGNELSPGDLMSFLVASQTVQRSMANMSVLFGQVVRGLSAGGRVFEFMSLEPVIPLSGGERLVELKGDVEFKDISFSYPTRPGHDVLKHFYLRIPAGKTVAIVGQSGGGKSTVAALLERFYDPNQGAVHLDGVDIRSLDPSWLRGEIIGFINQEPVLFGTSIMENIRFGRPDATDEEVYEAAKQANADGFICNFPNGYKTTLGERGVTLSGGQKQRVAIARALLKDPRILILDEATSALDSESEHAVQLALDRATSGRTVLVIAHRLSTIADADIIVVLSEGCVVESGSHRELLKKGGLYAELIKRQNQESQ
ncbi:mitochondrial potassium channel ATP-binding subunit isoform X1 [Pelobates fuscus]|uniref:mitochondrial potassium channel ATP-binding subunit isoform X1 n=1 Tax=Pelobates fuscus TaxID=191477 RepID=UPI002FE471DB